MQSFDIHPETDLGPVFLQTARLPRAVLFYMNVIGLRILSVQGNRVELGVRANDPLVILNEQRDAGMKPAGTTGLYHFALLLPTRQDLARLLRHLNSTDYPLQGASDHLVSEALYLADPDGNGIELYADRPRADWRKRDGQLDLATVPLDVADLLNASTHDNGLRTELPNGTRMGHIHLHVADLEAAEMFYEQVLGFERMARYGPGASFVSAGGYHHHIGMNTWIGQGAPPPPPNVVGMRYFTIRLPDSEAMQDFCSHLDQTGTRYIEEGGELHLQDPSGNCLHVCVRSEASWSPEQVTVPVYQPS